MNIIKTYNPGERAISRIEDLWSDMLWGESSFGAADIEEGEKEVCVSIDLPGVEASDIDLRLERGFLELSARREEERASNNGSLFHAERNWGKIRRTLSLPEIDPDSAKAKLEDGVLEIHLQKIAEEGSRIQIETQ